MLYLSVKSRIRNMVSCGFWGGVMPSNNRSTVLSACVTAAIGTFASAQLFAQENEEPQENDEAIEEVVVVGIRASLQDSLNIKRLAPNIVDAISAEDIGKFPDQNLAESMQRIPGVQISRDNGEGRNVTVRGLAPDFTKVTMNGRTIATSDRVDAGSNRSFDFKILPSDFIGAVEVYKTPMADLEEGALSATVNVRTQRPLDLAERAFVVTASAIDESNTDDITPDLTVLYSDKFANDTFGITAGAHYDERNVESQGFSAFGMQAWVEGNTGIDYNMDGDTEDEYRGLHLNQLVANPQDRERSTAMLNLQWQPDDATNVWLETLYSEFHSEGPTPGLALRFGNHSGPVTAFSSVPDTTYGSDGLVDYIEMTDVLINPDMRFVDLDNEFTTSALGASRRFGDWLVEAEWSYSKEEALQDTLGFVAWASADVFYDTRENGFGALPVDGFTSGAAPSSYYITNINGNYNNPSSGENSDFRVDVDRDMDFTLGAVGISSIEFGTKYSDRSKFAQWNNVDVSGAALEQLLGAPTIPDAIQPGWGGIDSAGWMTDLTFDNFLSGFDGRPSNVFSGAWPDIRLLDEADILAAGTFTVSDSLTIDVKEETLAGYFKVNFEAEGGEFSGNLGVRYVSTDQASFGNVPDLTSIRYNPSSVQTTVDSTPSYYERSYDEWLPSFNLRYNATDDLIVRFAAARVMSRPDLTILSPSTNIDIQTGSISAQNPDVDPYFADQIDLSLEWYMSNGGVLAIAPFAKFIDSFIVAATNETQITYFNEQTSQDETITALVSQPDNGTGSDMYGFEVNWIQPLDFVVDGMGFIYNTTIVQASDIQFAEDGAALPLPGLSRLSYNAIAYYENEKFGARLAYNYRDGFVEVSNTNFNNAIEVDPYYQMDFAANYSINDNLSLRLEALNITDSVLTKNNGIGIVRFVQDVGRRITFGLHARF